jgi:chromosomal replication initiation ATPase DnaA
MSVALPDIFGATSEIFDVCPRDLRSPYRDDKIAQARHAFCRVAADAGFTLTKIGAEINRHEATVRGSRNRATVLAQSNPSFASRIAALRACTLERAA